MICPTCGKKNLASDDAHTCHDPVMEAIALLTSGFSVGEIAALEGRITLLIRVHQAQLQRFWDRINEINRA